jgi:hypothetical protein
MEWVDAFGIKKKEAKDLQSQITQTEVEIEKMLYELYGLTKDGINIIESNLKVLYNEI